MRSAWKQSHLLLVAAVAIAATFAVSRWAASSEPVACADSMHRAAALCTTWFQSVAEMKHERGIMSDNGSTTRWAALLGDDYTYSTTTLGSLEAKETAANPEFAALIVRLFNDAGIDSTSTVGIMLSGSFPSLAIATLAATQTVGARAVVISSLGASTYGANQPGATWIDMEQWLREKAGLRSASTLVSLGGEDDNGFGMEEEGLAVLREAAARCSTPLYEPHSLQESITDKTRLLTDEHVSILVNIGGNEAAIGRCPQSSAIPNGLHEDWRPSRHPQRGVIARLAEQGVPYIHLLNIRDLAERYGLPIDPGQNPSASPSLYATTRVHAAGPTAGIALVIFLLCVFRPRRKPESCPVFARNGRGRHEYGKSNMD